MYMLLKCGGDGYAVDAEGYYHEYVCDTAADVADLPTGTDMPYSTSKPRPGSTALVTGTSSVYVLDLSRTWVVLIEGD